MLSIIARISTLSHGTWTMMNSPSLCLSGIGTRTFIFWMASTFMSVLASRMTFFHAAHGVQERRDFVKHSPEKVSVWRHPPNTFDQVVVPIPKVELLATIRHTRHSESRIETQQTGDREVKALNSLRIDRFGARSKRVFRVVCLADGTESILRTGAASDDMKYLPIHSDSLSDKHMQILNLNYRDIHIPIIPTDAYRYWSTHADSIMILINTCR